ncbi:MAG: TIGR02449 family protein [Gammaproteobacteria bacterium]
MANDDPVELELKRLEHRIDELIRTCESLKEENRALRVQRDDLLTERNSLAEKAELARTRVEAMISRLKTLEQGT